MLIFVQFAMVSLKENKISLKKKLVDIMDLLVTHTNWIDIYSLNMISNSSFMNGEYLQ